MTGCHRCRETRFQLAAQAPDLTFHGVLRSSHCTNVLAAEPRCRFDLELNAVGASPSDFVDSAALIGFWAATRLVPTIGAEVHFS